MRIPSGDLAPARKGRRRSRSSSRRGGYGRRRRRVLPVLLAVALVGGVAAGAYLLTRDDARAPRRTQQTLAQCAGPAVAPGQAASARAAAPRATRPPPPALPAPGAVALRLLNGTSRPGQARDVANELVARGFAVSSFGNAPRPLVGASTITYGAAAAPSARLLWAHVPGARLVAAPKAPRTAVDVVLGSSFAALRTPAQAGAVARQLSAGASAVAPPAPARTAGSGVRTPCR